MVGKIGGGAKEESRFLGSRYKRVIRWEEGNGVDELDVGGFGEYGYYDFLGRC